MAVFADVTPIVEPLSLDEAFLDVSGAMRRLGRPRRIAQHVRDRVFDEQGVSCSVGVASTKFVAKLASGLAKPDGLLVVPREQTLQVLHPLPVGALWGVGERTEEVLHRAVVGACDLSGMSSAAIARLGPGGWEIGSAVGPLAHVISGWDTEALAVLGGWVWAGTSSYFPGGENVPPGYEFLARGIQALSVQPLTVAGEVTGLLLAADTRTVAHDPALSSALELLAGQTAARAPQEAEPESEVVRP